MARRRKSRLHKAKPAYAGSERRQDTRFPVYSITKSFTTTAVDFLEADGKLKLDQPAADFIPEWRGDDRKGVLIRHLLSMSSGMSKQEQVM